VSFLFVRFILVDNLGISFVYNTAGQIQNNSAPSLFITYIIFLCVYFCLFRGYLVRSMLFILFIVSVSATLVYMLSTSKEQIRVSLLSSMTCKSVIRWMEFKILYIYGRCS
jgi:hypothetical protein